MISNEVQMRRRATSPHREIAARGSQKHFFLPPSTAPAGPMQLRPSRKPASSSRTSTASRGVERDPSRRAERPANSAVGPPVATASRAAVEKARLRCAASCIRVLIASCGVTIVAANAPATAPHAKLRNMPLPPPLSALASAVATLARSAATDVQKRTVGRSRTRVAPRPRQSVCGPGARCGGRRRRAAALQRDLTFRTAPWRRRRWCRRRTRGQRRSCASGRANPWHVGDWRCHRERGSETTEQARHAVLPDDHGSRRTSAAT